MQTEKEKMISGAPYSSNDEELIAARNRAKRLLKEYNVTEHHVTDSAKNILKQLIPSSHPSLYIEPPFHCDYGFNISTGENVYFNVNCVILDVTYVTIGSNVFFGPGVHIYTATHPLDYVLRRSLESGQPVTIGDDCWVGGGAIILPGITIGRRSVIGAGSVVTKDIPESTLAAGNPARILRSI